MSAPIAEVVFVIDASGSMAPCFKGLVASFDHLVRPVQGGGIRLRLGLVAHRNGRAKNGGVLHDIQSLDGGLSGIYSRQSRLFTEDPEEFMTVLRNQEVAGDEHTPLAIDCALDHPWSRLGSAQRVVAVFSDESVESGCSQPAWKDKVEALCDKIQRLRVKLFVAMPASGFTDALAGIDNSLVEETQGNGLANLDYAKLLGAIGKSISVQSQQASDEPPVTRAIFGQDRWGTDTGIMSGS